MRLLPAQARRGELWPNGHGLTTPVLAADEWRVSIAELRDASPFSIFGGSRRLLMPLCASGVRLSVNRQHRMCDRFEVCAFEGDDAVFATGIREPVEVLNLIWRPDRCHGRLTTVPVADPLELRTEAIALLAIVTCGRLATAEGITLSRLDGLCLIAGEAAVLSGDGHLALAWIGDPSTRAGGRA